MKDILNADNLAFIKSEKDFKSSTYAAMIINSFSNKELWQFLQKENSCTADFKMKTEILITVAFEIYSGKSKFTDRSAFESNMDIIGGSLDRKNYPEHLLTDFIPSAVYLSSFLTVCNLMTLKSKTDKKSIDCTMLKKMINIWLNTSHLIEPVSYQILDEFKSNCLKYHPQFVETFMQCVNSQINTLHSMIIETPDEQLKTRLSAYSACLHAYMRTMCDQSFEWLKLHVIPLLKKPIEDDLVLSHSVCYGGSSKSDSRHQCYWAIIRSLELLKPAITTEDSLKLLDYKIQMRMSPGDLLKNADILNEKRVNKPRAVCAELTPDYKFDGGKLDVN